MNRFFNFDNPVWRFLGGVFDAVVLNLCWIICSLPLITIGASTAALYHTLMNGILNEEGRFFSSYFKSFKKNLRQGIPFSLVIIAATGLLLLSLYALDSFEPTPVWAAIRGIDLVFGAVMLFTLQYVFILFAFFNDRLGNLVETSFFLSVRHFGRTLLMIAIPVLMAVAIHYLRFTALLLPGYGLVAYLDCYILKPVIKPLIKQALGDDAEEVDTSSPKKTSHSGML